jgi:hypothetical protein
MRASLPRFRSGVIHVIVVAASAAARGRFLM